MIGLILLLTLLTASGFLVADRVANGDRSIVGEAATGAGRALSPIVGHAARRRYQRILVTALIAVPAMIVLGYLAF